MSAQKSLIDQLIVRTKEIADSNAPRLTEAEIGTFAKSAEQEMFDMFGDTNMKYKGIILVLFHFIFHCYYTIKFFIYFKIPL